MRDENAIGTEIVDAAYKVHRALAPGLLESVYEAAMDYELTRRGLRVMRQHPINVFYEEHLLDVGFRADLLVEELVLIELKSVEQMTKLCQKVTNQLPASGRLEARIPDQLQCCTHQRWHTTNRQRSRRRPPMDNSALSAASA